MARPSEILREEHGEIAELLRVLQAMSAALERGERVPRVDIDLALDILVNFADRCHHAKEEKLLFPILVTASPTEGALLAGRLDEEHQAGRALVGSLRQLASVVGTGDPIVRTEFAATTRKYVAMLEDHIRREDGTLLPLMDAVFPTRISDAVAQEFERFDREVEDAHARYAHDIHGLAGRYVHAVRFP